MFIDLIVALSIMAIITGTLMLKGPISIGEKETYSGIIAFKKKLQAMNQSQATKISIIHGKINDQYAVPFQDCTLKFTASGTASKSGTCQGKKHALTLRPGEGGIGYPWQ